MKSGAEASYARGRLDGRRGRGQVLFGRMYEDAAIEIEAFAPGGRIFAIASAGCTAMALAADHEVVAVDINPAQLAYAQRRFQGEPAAPGTVERLMAGARMLGAVTGWWPSRVHDFLELDCPREQAQYWQAHLDTRRFRIAVDGLLFVMALRAVYAPAFLDFLPPRLGCIMRSRLQRCVGRHANASNPYLHGLLRGDAPTFVPLPKTPVQWVLADAADYLERQPAGGFDGFTLSNVTDGVEPAYARRLAAAVRRAAAPHAIVVQRSFGTHAVDSAVNRAADDRSALWGVVSVKPVHG